MFTEKLKWLLIAIGMHGRVTGKLLGELAAPLSG
jgi:hypothetical protein